MRPAGRLLSRALAFPSCADTLREPEAQPAVSLPGLKPYLRLHGVTLGNPLSWLSFPYLQNGANSANLRNPL